jgi:hypothetical protein
MVGGAAYYAGRKIAQGDEREHQQEARLQELEAQQQYGAPPSPYPYPQGAQPQYAAPPPQYAPAVAPSPPAAAPAAGGSAGLTPAEQLTSLKKLLDAGALTQEEFDVEKARVLRNL